MRRWESRRFKIRGGRKAVLREVEVVVDALNAGTFTFPGMHTRKTAKSVIFSTNNVGSTLVLRKINDNLRRLYKVKQANRSTIISQIISLLSEPIPKYILKLDVSRFYESIPLDTALKKVLSDGLISIQSKKIMRTFQSIPSITNISETSLPRGIGLSSTLSELFMRDFDKEITNTDGVYYYTRYVDDMILFCYKPPSNVMRQIEFLAQKHCLRLNPDKCKIIEVPACICKDKCKCGINNVCKCKTKCKCKAGISEYANEKKYYPPFITAGRYEYLNFDYLGYRFYFPPVGIGDRRSRVVVTLSDKKVSKIKNRIANSIRLFEKDNDFPGLRDRLRFLTSNYFLVGKEHGRLYAGIYYNYPDLTPTSPECPTKDALDKLDSFVRRAFTDPNERLGKIARAKLTRSQKRYIMSFSFKRGWEKKTIYKFSRSSLTNIKKAWLNEKNQL